MVPDKIDGRYSMFEALLQPSQVTLQALWHRIPKTVKLAFFSSLVTGLLVYLFALTNLLACTGDALNRIISSITMVSGEKRKKRGSTNRWLWPKPP